MKSIDDFSEQVKRIGREAYRLFPQKPKPEQKTLIIKWLDTIDKLLQKDKHSEEEILTVMHWATSHHFWSLQVQSCLKLRRTDREGIKYFDKLKFIMTNEKRTNRKADTRNLQPISSNAFTGIKKA